MPVERKRGRAGQTDRKRRMARTHGLCEHCQAAGRVTLAERVNHIVPLIHGGLDVDENTENLCRPCDIIATAKQFAFKAPMEARGVGIDGRPTSPDHPWNRPRAA